MRRFVGGLSAILMAGVLQCYTWVHACSIHPDPPIWTKNPKSNVALFRVVVNGKAGYIDTQGRILIEPQFEPFYLDPGDGDFIDGRARVLARQGDKVVQVVIDETGTIVSHVRDSDDSTILKLGEQSEGLQAFAVLTPSTIGPPAPRRTHFRGYLDASGRVAIAPQFAYAGPFSEGLAAVALDGKCWVSGYRGGRFPAPSAGAVYTSCGPMPDASITQPCHHGYIDASGKLVIEAEYELAREFSERRSAVRAQGRWGFIDSSGRQVVDFRYQQVRNFSEQKAAVQLDGRWGYVDLNGAVVIPTLYDDALSFSGGLAPVKSSEGYIFIDPEGRKALPGSYVLATPFVMGLAHVKTGRTTWSWINHKGKTVFTYDWDQDR